MLLDGIRWVAWNTFLAVIPVLLAYVIAWIGTRWRQSAVVPVLIVLGLVWLAFLPNTCYLFTEWRHFLALVHRDGLYAQWTYGHNPEVMMRMVAYSLFFLGYSLIGLVTFGLAIRPVARLLTGYGLRTWVLALPFFPLVSLGVYLGLVLRFNSWDLAHRPGVVFAGIADALTNPTLLGMILAFAAFLWLAYLVFDIWVDGLLFRLHTAGACQPHRLEGAER